MTDSHSYSFFSESNAVILVTRDYNDEVHLNFIRKKADGNWEKFDEGLHLELKVNEICKILDFLDSKTKLLTITHKHPKSTTIKEVQLSKSKKKDDQILNITGKIISSPESQPYSNDLMNEDIRLFRKILEHLEVEKIANLKTM